MNIDISVFKLVVSVIIESHDITLVMKTVPSFSGLEGNGRTCDSNLVERILLARYKCTCRIDEESEIGMPLLY